MIRKTVISLGVLVFFTATAGAQVRVITTVGPQVFRPFVYGGAQSAANYVGSSPYNGFNARGLATETVIGGVGGAIGTTFGGPLGGVVGSFIAPPVVYETQRAWARSTYPIYGMGNTSPQVYGRRNCLSPQGFYFAC